MQFLWQLLPGARETRNQVIVGYAWVIAIALWLGVPALDKGSELRELTDAVGPIGVGIALGFGAFLLGSLSDDIVSRAVGIRGAAAFSLERGLVDVHVSSISFSLMSKGPPAAPEADRGPDALARLEIERAGLQTGHEGELATGTQLSRGTRTDARPGASYPPAPCPARSSGRCTPSTS